MRIMVLFALAMLSSLLLAQESSTLTGSESTVTNQTVIKNSIENVQAMIAPTTLSLTPQGVVLSDSTLVAQFNSSGQRSAGFERVENQSGLVTKDFTRPCPSSSKTQEIVITSSDHSFENVKSIQFYLIDQGRISLSDAMSGSRKQKTNVLLLENVFKNELGKSCFRSITIYNSGVKSTFTLSDKGIWQ
ncbi:MAG: hypothetical protein PHO32_03965 [Candidatus Cloacimonetes bacterium]|nr:hypothetical protein [Candidatus Cloacimonadota bacterium]